MTKPERSIVRRIMLNGIVDIMFDPYAGDNQTELRPEEKMYFASDGRTLVLPAANIMSFLSAENTESAPKRLLDARKYKVVAKAALSYVIIEPMLIPLTREGKPIRFNGFVADEDAEAGIYIHYAVARLNKGIPNPKVRPTVRMPWELEFKLRMYENDDLNESTLRSLFIDGGLAIGLGTYRGVYGKFEVAKWEGL